MDKAKGKGKGLDRWKGDSVLRCIYGDKYE